MEKDYSSITTSLHDFFLEAKVSSPLREDAARALHMNVRMLSRRLKEAGTSYSVQLYQFRLARAFEYLASHDKEKKTMNLPRFHGQTKLSQTVEPRKNSHATTRSSKKTPQPRNWLDKPSKLRIAYRAFASNAHDDEALYTTHPR